MNHQQPLEDTSEFYNDVINGLNKPRKSLPSKYFYDKKGSMLFEQICSLDEYYLTRAEIEIMQTHIGEICRMIGNHALLVELGSGSSSKTRLLLKHLHLLAGYIPVDISADFLKQVVTSLKKNFPSLHIEPVAADYTQPFSIPHRTDAHRTVIYYPGSTLGNFTRSKAKHFLQKLAGRLKPGDGLLLGIDLKKDQTLLEAAYNDSQGVTAAFNKNLLNRINRELQADFNPDLFEHEAFYNADEGRMEMHLVSKKEQTVRINNRTFYFKQGEYLHTENSYKYDLKDISDLASNHFDIKESWTDSRNYFSVFFLEVA